MSSQFLDSNDLKLCTERFLSQKYDSVARFFGLYQCCVCNHYLSTFCDTCLAKTIFATPECSICRKFSQYGKAHHICLTNALVYNDTLSLFSYTKEIKSLFRIYKYDLAYQYQRSLEKLTAEYFRIDPFCLLKHKEAQFSGKHIVLIPVPMTRKKRDDRGFSPAYEFALIVGRLLRDMFECRVSVCPELLVKVTDSEAQAKKNRKQRLLALSKSYVLKEVLVSEFIEGKPQIVCIVDDVLTTGATTTTILDQFSINTRLKAYLKTILLVRITFASA